MSEHDKRPYSMMTLEQLREEFIFTLETSALPRELLYEVHTRLWAWILKHADEFPSKRNWPGWDAHSADTVAAEFGGHRINSRCFLCAAHDDCRGCPLWKMNSGLRFDGCGIYFAWRAAREHRDLDRFRELTQLILNAPNWLLLDESHYTSSDYEDCIRD